MNLIFDEFDGPILTTLNSEAQLWFVFIVYESR